MSNIPVTEHFTIAECACHDGTPYPIGQIDDEDPQRRCWMVTRLVPLCSTAEIIRHEAGDLPLIFDSVYRTLEYDQKLYDAHMARLAAQGLPNDHKVAEPTSSDHPRGRAGDMRHSKLSAIALFNLILRLFEAGKLPNLTAVGLYPDFVHISVGKRAGSNGGAIDGHLRIWGGTRPTNVV